MEPNSIYGQHLKALEASKVHRFVLYSVAAHLPDAAGRVRLRLLDDGPDRRAQFRLQFSARYVHPSEDKVLEAISRLDVRNFGHNQLEQKSASDTKLLATDVQ